MSEKLIPETDSTVSTLESSAINGLKTPLPSAQPESDTEGSPPQDDERFKVNRILKVAKPLIKGDDVKALQNALIARGFHCGIKGANGIYEMNTASAVRHFQAMHRLIVDGRAGKFTVTALGGLWEE